jgi:glutathione S-transferase
MRKSSNPAATLKSTYLIVHHLQLSQSERIVWLCEELAIPYELRCYERHPRTGEAPAQYKALHPMRLAPVVEHDGRVLAESGAIIEYLLRKYGNGRLEVGGDERNFADYLFWFHFANATLMSSEQTIVVASLLGTDVSNEVVALLNERSERAWSLIEHRLGEADYFAGDGFTAADVMMLFPLTTMRILATLRKFTQRDLTPLPNIRRYLQRVTARPAYRRAMEKAEPGREMST